MITITVVGFGSQVWRGIQPSALGPLKFYSIKRGPNKESEKDCGPQVILLTPLTLASQSEKYILDQERKYMQNLP